MTHKPAKNHPWRRQVQSEVAKWAKEKSDVLPVNQVVAARPETLKHKVTKLQRW